MYLEHFKLKRKAFSKTPDPQFFFANLQFEEALARMLYACEERELALLSGEIGSGKTMLTRALIDQLDESYEVGMILHPKLTTTQLMRMIAMELGIRDPSFHKADLLMQLQDRLFTLHDEGRTPVLIVDEAHLIPQKSSFDDIRLISNFQLDEQNLLAIIIVGQPEILKRLGHHSYDALTQRFGVEYHLTPLVDAEEVESYMTRRLEVAGAGKRKLFLKDAIEEIFAASMGVPRVINNIATQCLLDAMSRDKNNVDCECVRRVVAGLRFLPRNRSNTK